MATLHPHKTGLALGGMLGLFHLCWALLIALGIAQPFIDFIFKLHMISPVYVIMPFSLSLTIGLVVVTGFIGYVTGYIFAAIWNKAQK